MKTKGTIRTLLTAVCVLLGIFSMSRVFSEMTHHTGTGRSIALHVGSAVLWFAVAWVLSRRRPSGEEDIPPSQLASSIQKRLALPYKLLSDKVPPDALMRFFRRTRKEAAGQGFTPILVPVSQALDDHLAALSNADGPTSAETALAAPPPDGKAVLDRRWRTLFASEEEAAEPPAELLGDMAGSREQIHFLSCQSDGAPIETLMLRLPTDQAWQAAAYLPVGGHDGMPETGELLAVCKYWYDRYRAVPAAVGYNTMEFMLPKVIDKAQAMEVAKEHYAFCPDRVRRDSASGTLGEVADGLWQSTLWYFRWGETPSDEKEAAIKEENV